MATKEIARGKNSKQKPKSRFQQLWAEAEQLARDSAELEKQLSALVSRIDREIFSAERELGESVRQMVYRQIEFAGRKSLPKWQRAELNEWISENLSELTHFGLVDDSLQNAVAKLRAEQLGIDLDPNSDLSAREQLDKYFDMDDPDDDNDNWWDEDTDATDCGSGSTGDLFDDTLEDMLDDDDGDLEEDEALAELLRKLHAEFAQHDDPPPVANDRKRVDDSVFKRLFRQTAAALHPDRETDEDRQQEKHILMSQLLKARKERDLITVIQMHEQHASAESTLSVDDEQALEEVLVDYLNQQQSRMDDIIFQSPMHHMAYSAFYAKKPATVTRKINAHLKKVDARRQSIHHFITEVKTLKSLKLILEARYESRFGMDEWF